MKQAPAHQASILASTKWNNQFKAHVNEIASTGYPVEQYAKLTKVQKMQAKLRRGEKLPPVKLEKLDDESRDRLGVRDPNKKFYLRTGHHRLAAHELEGRSEVNAVPYEGKGL